MEIRSKEISIVPVGQLKMKTNNRNKHPDSQIDALAKHFAYQGFRNPLIVSNQSGEIVCGNGRFLAAKKAGIKELPVIFQDFDNPDQEYAYHVADNGLSLWSELDMSGINQDMLGLGPDFDVDLLGINGFLIDLSEIEEQEPEEEETKEKLKFIICPHCEQKFEQGQALTIKDGFRSVLDE